MKSVENYFILETSDILIEDDSIFVIKPYVEGESFMDFVNKQNEESQMGNFLSVSVFFFLLIKMFF